MSAVNIVGFNAGSFIDVVTGHHVHGANAGSSPQFTRWPRWNSLTHQMMYWEQLRRAYDGGLRLLVTHAVNSEFLCSVINRVYSCDDMPAVDRQIQAAHDLEAFIDSEHGGSGRGWYRIVRTPQEARTAIANNQLAVVLGIEVPDLFACATDQANCTPNRVREQLDKYYGMGVRHLFPIHSIDSPFGGTAFFQDIYRIAQVKLTGTDFTSRDCSNAGVSFKFKTNAFENQAVAVIGNATRDYPNFGGAADCNAKGLGTMGIFLLEEMKARGMLIDVDHMSLLAREQALAWANRNTYPIVSSHSGILDTSYGTSKRHEAQQSGASLRTIFDLGGSVGLITAQGKTGGPNIGDGIVAHGAKVANNCSHSSRTFVQAYLAAVDALGGRDRAAVAFGTDMQSAIHQPGPRFGDEACTGGPDDERATQGAKENNGVRYPFQYSGMNFQMGKSQMLSRIFDVNEDGVSHVGMLPDFIADLLAIGVSDDDLKPLFRSAESYIQTWEKAVRAPRSATAPASTIHLELQHSARTEAGGTVTVHAADWRTGAAIRTAVYLDGEKAGETGLPIDYRHRADGRPLVGFVLPEGHLQPRAFELPR